MAEDILAELERSEWIQVDDRAVILTKLITASQQVAHSAMGLLTRELQMLDSSAFVMEKKTRVRRLQDFIHRLRARMQQWVDISVPAFSGMPSTMGVPMAGGAMGMGATGAGASALVGNPLIDIFEDGINLIVRASLPGMNMDNTFVGVVNGGTCLELAGEAELENKSFFRKEIPAGKFKRVIRLPYTVEEDSADASLSDGFLTVKMVKKGSTKIDIA
jgi:HSP20 family molecular chaperone IbpA